MKCCNFVSSLIDDSDECDNGGSENTSQLEKNSDAKQLTLEDYRSDAESKNIDVWFGGSHFVFEYQISKCAMEWNFYYLDWENYTKFRYSQSSRCYVL